MNTEEDWMAQQGPASEFRLNLNQTAMLQYANRSNLFRYTNGNNNNNNNNGTNRPTPTMGTDRDFMWGFMLGFFVGFVMILWIWLPTIPHKQKLGILTGLSFQLAFGVAQDEQEDEFDIRH